MRNKELEEKIRFNIAISEFGKKYKIEEKKKFSTFLIRKVAIIIIAISILVIGGVQAINLLHFFNRELFYGINSVSDSINNGYEENINMDYSYSDGIGLKINSFTLSDIDLNLVFDFKSNGKCKLDNTDSYGYPNFEFAYIVYNENYQIYYSQLDLKQKLIKMYEKRSNLKYNYNYDMLMGGGGMTITCTEDNIVYSDLVSIKDIFPKAKKLYVDVVGIGYFKENIFKKFKYKPLSNSEWHFELDVPEKFYLDKSVEYDLKEADNKIDIEKMIVSSTRTLFKVNVDCYWDFLRDELWIIDENGKEYKAQDISLDETNEKK